jgi:hypothetical protein
MCIQLCCPVPITHTEMEVSFIFVFIVWEEMYYHSSVVLICESVYCYPTNNISLQNLFTYKHYRKKSLAAVMVANFDTILLGQQPCQAVQIN